MEELGREEKWGLGRVCVCACAGSGVEEATSEDPLAPVAINNRY